ncbi:UDP-N-acetylmuramoylalanyl-D-glutamate--2,6-diaminopimelate ligase [Andreprevotia lacus DSM 23236]|jgi:UDP-N-acetylmuramoyl-L-alanyl-D-glutamate--2,6-diaminopimelate ligase|uniref:UDP-N-acetylmuramoyl-L-alanyl-D-glutamate--2,6-diaminopimelate ligase n=1 Tax=Andreprevotia lacus DSM 23236 TaxID=1121001 RepID=A0A1W1XS36_9NEIS|nr:UDP-N-acetylmuramoyl-L-alanyl-D-glutamate--2,6-diaminopimelate ligase [Andreprevotia lacus]SMC26674.1 UDP-N-acetylmuramoylalanyl-D-glutamate--2,6-diaminopimelate ligase [Andreprevotia lacus DSM 23236]
MKPQSWNLPPLDLAAIDALAAGRRFVMDSRKVQAGDVFLAFQGEYADGRSYIDAAIAAGAGAVIWEADDFTWNPAWTVPNLAVPQLRAQAGIVASHLLGDPSARLAVIGITGTNGKTSIANWLGQALSALGHQTGVLGTLGNGLYPALIESTHTTLDPVALQQWLGEFAAQGASHVAMEVSSHGLAQARAHGTQFKVAVFTNLTRDHLDYHGTMQQYGAEKARLFDWQGLQAAVINADDAFGAELIKSTSAPRVYSYGIQGGDIRALRIGMTLAGLNIDVTTPLGEATIHSRLIGSFNAYNLLACLGVLLALDVPLADAVQVLGQIESAPGRMQRLGGDGKPLVVVDYAHTPDALEKALATLKQLLPQGSRLYCVFGCGGDRDPGKRPMMGEVACRLADAVVITSDNPRSETPRAIINDIIKGVAGVPGTGTDNYTIESDRSDAIGDAIALAGPGDVVLIAGKGHENYQEVNGVRHHFDDVEVAAAALQRKKA